MSFFDDALKEAVPGGDLTTPIAIAAGALLLHHFMSGHASAPAPAPAPPPAQTPGYGRFSRWRRVARRVERPGQQIRDRRRGRAGQFLGRHRREPADQHFAARLGARAGCLEPAQRADRPDPATARRSARASASAVRQQSDAERPLADGRGGAIRALRAFLGPRASRALLPQDAGKSARDARGPRRGFNPPARGA